MTEQISLRELRERIAKHPVTWPHDELLALVEAVEAALALANERAKTSRDFSPTAHRELLARCDAALARFRDDA